MKMTLTHSMRSLLLLAAIAGGTGYLLSSELKHVPTSVGLVGYVVLLFFLRSHKVLVSLLLTLTLGVLLILSWRRDNTGGLLPTLYTVVFLFSLYDIVMPA